MCGIAGILSVDREVAIDAMKVSVGRMVAAIAHRGPDGEGAWCEPGVALGHRRLSIIDLTHDADQPMHSRDGRYVLVFNGEIYNYRELRDELIRTGREFRSASDTEVILEAYAEWGPSCLERFNGMWALALWDRARKRLFASRDRAGKKPFYYTIVDGRFYFASEVKALRALGMRFGADLQAVFDFLTQGTYGHRREAGFLTGVQQLPPGHSLVVEPGGIPELSRYWSLPVVAEHDRLPYDAAFRSRFRDVLSDAVKLRLRSDVPVGATLSGGLDSSALVLLMNEQRTTHPLHVFTSLYPGTSCDETPYFDAVAERLACPVIHRVAPNGDEWREMLLSVLDHQEEPFGDTSIFAHFNLMRAAREAGIPVVLSGQGGDELLLGYDSMVSAYLGHLLRTGRLRSAMSEIDQYARSPGRSKSSVLRGAMRHLLPLELRDLARRNYVHRRGDILTAHARRGVILRRFAPRDGRADIDTYIAQVFERFALPHLLHYDDRNAMAFGVEGRMPFLDHRLVELVFAAQYEALFHGGMTKRVLRESLDGLLPPLVIARRDKIGFYTPLAAWMRANAQWIESFMSRDRLNSVGLVNASRYRERLIELREGNDGAELDVWRGFIVHLWLERCDVDIASIRHVEECLASA